MLCHNSLCSGNLRVEFLAEWMRPQKVCLAELWLQRGWLERKAAASFFPFSLWYNFLHKSQPRLFIIIYICRWLLALCGHWKHLQSHLKKFKGCEGEIERMDVWYAKSQVSRVVSSAGGRALTYSKILWNICWNSVTWMNLTSIMVNEMSQTQEYVQYNLFHKTTYIGETNLIC